MSLEKSMSACLAVGHRYVSLAQYLFVCMFDPERKACSPVWLKGVSVCIFSSGVWLLALLWWG